jgi:Flp pilus assembly protein protease CpaA
MRRNLSTNSIAAIVLFTYVVLFVAISTIAIPDIDTMESADRFFWTILAGAVGGKVLFLVLLIRNIDYYTYQLGQALVLAFLFVAMLGCFYLYLNARMGTGIFENVTVIRKL